MNAFCRTVLAAALAGLCLGAADLAISGQGLEFEDAWVRAMPPGMKMTAAFGRLHNSSEDTIELESFSSPRFADVSLHRSETVDGVSRMREVSGLTVAAGETVELKPGGLHLMLMMPRASEARERPVTLVMTAASGDSYTFELPVERR